MTQVSKTRRALHDLPLDSDMQKAQYRHERTMLKKAIQKLDHDYLMARKQRLAFRRTFSWRKWGASLWTRLCAWIWEGITK